MKVTVSVRRPAAYLIPPGWPQVEERIRAHGLKTTALSTPRTIRVETYRVSDVRFSDRPYQGRHPVTATVRRATEERSFPQGTLVVPLDTELATLAIHLLDPEAPDSLFAWGLLSSVVEGKEWIDLRVLDPLAESLLGKDPALRAEWERKLQDPSFSGDPRARIEFFVRRSPYADETLGLIPVFAVYEPVS
jgi:hypothetical protein